MLREKRKSQRKYEGGHYVTFETLGGSLKFRWMFNWSNFELDLLFLAERQTNVGQLQCLSMRIQAIGWHGKALRGVKAQKVGFV